MKSMLHEIGVKVQVVCKTDASAAQGIALRKGLGKVKHIDVTQLWLQDKVAEGIGRIIKVGTKRESQRCFDKRNH